MPRGKTSPPAPAIPELVARLLPWFAANARDLPWRRTTDPYAVWISEIMLQQTQVKTVIPYWERWLHELPDVAALAATPEDRVLKLWEGLGYYTRARNLQRTARLIVTQHCGAFPRGFNAILALPGIGRYTAGAIAKASPMAIMDVVLAVGAKLNGHASFGTRTFNTTSLCRATVDLIVPVTPMIFTDIRFSAGKRLTNSSDSPE